MLESQDNGQNSTKQIEPSMTASSCWTTFSQLRLYAVLFVITTFVNKYVLSILEFKYPTIFQGWQTLVGFLVMKMLVATRYLKPMQITDSEKRSDLIRWIPSMVFFVISIYSGSKGLAELSIPVFLAIQNITVVFDYLSQMIMYRKLTSAINYLMCMVIAISSLGIVLTDPQFHHGGYFWICVHILSTGLLMLYTNMTKGRLKISPVEKLHCNYIYSIVILTPSSYLLGDALEAVKYPYLYFSKFYVGCCVSGVFGVLLNLYTIRLQEKVSEGVMEFSRIHGLVKIITSVISLSLFNDILTAEHAACLMINHLAALACEDTSYDQPINKSSTKEEPKQILSKHNVLYNDYLKENDNKDYII
ncbi:UDP-N-acetylglucosamine transporter TMEM241 homolog [Mytilus edulis]|uniref:UDP-N-acetylglucosamine transporter TMEM241 homolog n=1 Tax=Mytilus edulis TaxID=6550 RepID=UPI0039F08FB2